MDSESPQEGSWLDCDEETPPSTPEYVPRKIPKSQKNETSPIDLHSISLDQYLPIGSLRFSASCLAESSTKFTGDEWVEATDFLPEVADPEVPWKALVELWRAHWVRIICSAPSQKCDWRIWRIYVLPDDVARSTIRRDSNKLRKALGQVLQSLDVSLQTWSGQTNLDCTIRFDPWAAGENHSLFYMFNTLPSPAPSSTLIKDSFAKAAMEEILGPHGKIRGLTTPLYPYQKRSVAMMLQRECAPQLQLDPRLEPRVTPSGTTFYYGARDHVLFQNPRFYDSVCGGILAETMGLGKTLMCIALVLATRGHWPKVPLRYSVQNPRHRSKVGTLVDLSAAAVAANGIPWRKVFEDIKFKQGLDMTNCIEALATQVPTYEIPPRSIRSNRSSTFSTPPEEVRLCMGTIIVVPKNLLHQWQSELAKHTAAGVLKVLVMTSPKEILPAASELAKYDIILFSRTRFESEAKKTTALDMDWYESPLKGLHWLRIIIDEGHNFSSSNTNAGVVADNLVRAERRWIVSGTPARDLLGVEVEMDVMTCEGSHDDVLTFREKSLEQRKDFSIYQEDSSGAVKSLGALASNYLKAEPWAGAVGFEGSAKWDEYIYRHEGYQARTHTCFSSCFRRTLENLVIKTRPSDVERDIELPHLSHKIVRLEPSFYDKLTANLFVLVFTSNAVTSERTDIDYLFHKGSATHLHRLIATLRQSAFYWTGFKAEHVAETIKITSKYLKDNGAKCSKGDRDLLAACIGSARIALSSPCWTALSTTEEMGIFLDDWPTDAIEQWALEECTSPVMLGLTHSVAAQKYVNNNLSSENPAAQLGAAGVEMKAEQELAISNGTKSTVKVVSDSQKMEKKGVPSINLHTDKTRLSASGVVNNKSPKKTTKSVAGGARMRPEDEAEASEKPKRGKKRRLSVADSSVELASNSELGQTCVAGTTSTKFSYLIDRILELHTEEKILIFFDANYQAYYISQMLDLFHVKHLIYANTLNNEQRGKYIVLFDTDPGHRVLLMDIKQAAHGLNLSSASRVFFINPVCRPGIEAQAIKRAHRIGQTRPVYVETLLLKGTVEEAMHDRASTMTRYEHMQASKFLEDDADITRIIQQAKLLQLHMSEREGRGQMAALKAPQQLFGRPKRGGATATRLEKELFGDGAGVGFRDGDGEGEKIGDYDDDGLRELGKKPAKKRKTTMLQLSGERDHGTNETEALQPVETDNNNGNDSHGDDGAGVQGIVPGEPTPATPSLPLPPPPPPPFSSPSSTQSLTSSSNYTSLFGGSISLENNTQNP